MSLTVRLAAARLLVRPRSTVISHSISTRTDGVSRQEGQEENSRIFPRHIRRQLAFADSAKKSSSSPSHEKSSKHESKFRSKHYDPSKQEGRQMLAKSSELKLLEPHVLSQRLKKLCDANQIDAAVSMLKNSPLDAQNTPVWNTLIWEAMKVKRFKLGYSLYVDMKRRGHSPTTRTFQTMFNGLSRIEHWSTHAQQLANARSLYEAYQKHTASVKKEDPRSPHLSVDPLAAYIKILGDAGRYQDIFDVYYAMDSEGPLAPNQLIYTAIFRALSSKPEATGDRSVPYLKNAADAKLLWKQMLKASLKSPPPASFTIDSYIASAAVAALTRGGPSEQALAFQIVRDYFGLCAPADVSAVSAENDILPLQPASLDVILRLCNYTKKHDLCLHFVQQVKRRPEDSGGPSILDRGHMEEVLKAHLSVSVASVSAHGARRGAGGDQALATVEWMLRQEITGKNGPKIRPTLSTFNLAMTACWRSGDWQSAARAFELMTGYRTHDFMDGAVAMVPRLDKRSPDRCIIPTPEIASSMVRAALASGDRANMRQCLRIIYHLGLPSILSRKIDNNASHASLRHAEFYTSKLCSAILEVVDRVKGDRDTLEELKKWEELRVQASQLKGAQRVSNFLPMQESH